ncbi:MAG: SDR family oxidoreductase [Deltaproteobacteria bacterium]|nr:SDR family oxidoreductase [Deltaproteobacteria bacterium]
MQAGLRVGARRNFRGKVVVITGAAGGMGRALSLRFGRAGARLGLLDIEEKLLGALVRELSASGVDALGLPVDVTEEAACDQAMSRVVEHFGRVDVLVNNAGITHRSAFALTDMKVYRRVMDINYFGSLHCAKAALGQLIRNRGLIVVVSSIAGFAPLLGRTGYAASKHALHGFFDSLRAELQGTGIAVTIVCPGYTATGIEKSALGEDGSPTTHPQSRVGKMARPEQVAEAILRAASREKRLVILSTVGRLTRIMTRVCPSLYERLMARSLRSELDR